MNYFFSKNNICFIILSIIVTSCSVNPPNKTKSLNDNTIWVGGSDGGYWIDIINISSDSSLTAKIFLEHNGNLVSEGEFFSNKPVHLKNFRIDELKQKFSFVSENQIGLSFDDNNLVLKKR